MSIKLSGEGAILLSAAAYALSSGMIKKYSKDENPVVLSGYQFFLGGIILVVVGIATGGKISGFTLASIALLIYMAMISAVAYTLWGILLKYNPVGKVAVLQIRFSALSFRLFFSARKIRLSVFRVL